MRSIPFSVPVHRGASCWENAPDEVSRRRNGASAECSVWAEGAPGQTWSSLSEVTFSCPRPPTNTASDEGWRPESGPDKNAACLPYPLRLTAERRPATLILPHLASLMPWPNLTNAHADIRSTRQPAGCVTGRRMTVRGCSSYGSVLLI